MPDIWEIAGDDRQLTGGELRDRQDHEEALARMRFCGHDPFAPKTPAEPREKKGQMYDPVAQEVIAKMRLMRADGATLKMIAQRFGVATSTVWDHLRRAG
jgi:hypothetical protein